MFGPILKSQLDKNGEKNNAAHHTNGFTPQANAASMAAIICIRIPGG